MECSICMDEITKETGCVTLSCQHNFHYRCIDNWFGKQVWDDLPQTCPCCRSEGGHLDRCEVIERDQEDEEEGDEDYESETASIVSDNSLQSLESDVRWERVAPGRWLVINSSVAAFEALRSVFGPLNEPEFEEDPKPEAALKIQAILRGYIARNHYRAVRALMALRQ